MNTDNRQPLFSIVIPVYNSEKYLRRCLDSIQDQTYTDYEVILVDDGCKDSSPQICDEYATKDERFMVFHYQNGGPSKVRNMGLTQSRGVYTIH